VTSEREAKLSVPEGFVLPPLEGLPGRVVARADPVWETYGTAYLDTPDLRLAGWGCSLRFREGQGWTLKLPPARDGVLLIRDEHRFDGPSAGRASCTQRPLGWCQTVAFDALLVIFVNCHALTH